MQQQDGFHMGRQHKELSPFLVHWSMLLTLYTLVKGVRDLVLRPNVILFLLLLADVLVHVNRFSPFLQSPSLVYTAILRKLSQLTSNLEKLRNEEGYYMKQHGNMREASCRFRRKDRNCHDRPVNMATELMQVSMKPSSHSKKKKCTHF